MTLANYLTLGRSGLRVSPFCLGTMTFGEDWGWGSSPTDSKKILQSYMGAGGNFIDTANVYTFGNSEKIIGEFFKENQHSRQKAVIATKFFGTLNHGDPNGGGAGRKSILAACENSLRRLQTDYIDLYWMHCWDIHTPIEETLRTLDDLVTSGKVRYIGFSDTPAWKVTHAQMISQLRGWSPLIAIQLEYSLAERGIEGELVPMALEFNLGITPWSPLKSGVLSGKYTRANHGKTKALRGAWAENGLTEKNYQIIDALQSIAQETQSTPARVALAWVQAQPAVASTIIGARTAEQLEDNLAALTLKLSPGHLNMLTEISKPQLNFPFDFVRNAGSFRSSGTTINGEVNAASALAPTGDLKSY